MQFTADINNSNIIKLDPTFSINTPYANNKDNTQDTTSPFNAIDRLELQALFIQTEHNENAHMLLHTLDRLILVREIILHSC
jgi:hypothetical protein